MPRRQIQKFVLRQGDELLQRRRLVNSDLLKVEAQLGKIQRLRFCVMRRFQQDLLEVREECFQTIYQVQKPH